MSHLFDLGSSAYAAVRPSYPADLYRFLAAQCRETGRAWDCACGSGQAALGLAEFFSEIEATDRSPNQIEHAFRHPKVRYTVCPSEKTPFAARTFDLVCVAQALHWFDFGLFWPEVTRVLKPGGVFAAWGYSWTAINADVDRVLGSAILETIAPFWAEENRLLWNGYREVALPFATIPVPEFRMTTRWNLAELLAYVGTWSATKRGAEALGDGFLEKAYRQLLAVWGDALEPEEVRMAFHCVVGRNQP